VFFLSLFVLIINCNNWHQTASVKATMPLHSGVCGGGSRKDEQKKPIIHYFTAMTFSGNWLSSVKICTYGGCTKFCEIHHFP